MAAQLPNVPNLVFLGRIRSYKRHTLNALALALGIDIDNTGPINVARSLVLEHLTANYAALRARPEFIGLYTAGNGFPLELLGTLPNPGEGNEHPVASRHGDPRDPTDVQAQVRALLEDIDLAERECIRRAVVPEPHTGQSMPPPNTRLRSWAGSPSLSDPSQPPGSYRLPHDRTGP